MKKTVSLILTVMMILSALPLTVSAETGFPAIPGAPEIVYAWEKSDEAGTEVYCELLNSDESVALAQLFEDVGQNEWERSLGTGYVQFQIQIAYSFDNGATWLNDSGEDVLGNDWYVNEYAPDVPGDYPEDFVSLPFPAFYPGRNSLYQCEKVLDLKGVYTEYSDYSRADLNNKAAYLSQGKAFYTGTGEEEPNYFGYALDFNKNTMLMKARYLVYGEPEEGEPKRICGEWGNTFELSGRTTPENAGFDIPSNKKYNTPGFELRSVYGDDELQGFLFTVTPDRALARLFAEHDAICGCPDEELLENVFGEDTRYNVTYKLEMRLNGGEWKPWYTIESSCLSFNMEDWEIKNKMEDLFGVTPGASDEIEARLHFIPENGAEEDENGCLSPTAGTFAYTDLSDPVRIPMNGLYYIHYECGSSGSFGYGKEQIREFGKNSTEVIDLTADDYIPERYGYRFGGWYADEEYTEAVTTIDTSDKRDYTVYAKWIGDEYTITYDLDGISAYNPNEDYYTPYMDNIELEPASCDGVTFKGWSYTKGGEFVEFIDVSQAKDLTLYAVWEFPSHGVTYVLDGGVNAPGNPASVRADETGLCEAELSAPTKPGFLFDGWYYDAEYSSALLGSDGKWTLRLSGSTSVYAKWILGRWDIRYILPEANKGVYQPNPAQYTYGDTVTLAPIETDGYTFDGWFTDAAYTKSAASPAVTAADEGEKTFYGKFTEKSYQITYNVYTEDAERVFENTNPTTRLYSQNVVLADLVPLSPLYKFFGWYDNVNFDGNPVKEIIDGTDKNTVVYAKIFRYQWGDVDFDGEVTAGDARLVLRGAVGLDALQKDQIAWGNLDQPGDGELAAADARLVLRLSVGLESPEGLGLPEIPPELVK